MSVDLIVSEVLSLLTLSEDRLGRALEQSEIDEIINEALSGLDTVTINWQTLNYSPDQPRDNHGRFARVGSGTSSKGVQSRLVPPKSSSIGAFDNPTGMGGTASRLDTAKDILKATYDGIASTVKTMAPPLLSAAKATAKVGGKVLSKGLKFIRDRYGNYESMVTFGATAALFTAGAITVASAGGAIPALGVWGALSSVAPSLTSGVGAALAGFGVAAPAVAASAGTSAVAVGSAAVSTLPMAAAFGLAAVEAKNVVGGIAAFSEKRGSSTREEGLKRLTRGFTSNASLDAWANDTLQLIKDLAEALKVQMPPVSFEQVREALSQASASIPTTNLQWVTINADDEEKAGKGFDSAAQRKAFFGKKVSKSEKGSKSKSDYSRIVDAPEDQQWAGKYKVGDKHFVSKAEARRHIDSERDRETATKAEEEVKKSESDKVADREKMFDERTQELKDFRDSVAAAIKKAGLKEDAKRVARLKIPESEEGKAILKRMANEASDYVKKMLGKQFVDNAAGRYLSPKGEWVTLNNCGIGKGGFQKGNKCASGGGNPMGENPSGGGSASGSANDPGMNPESGQHSSHGFISGASIFRNATGAMKEAKDVANGIFSRMTLGIGPLVTKGIAAGIRHSPKAFRLLSKAMMAMAPKKRIEDKANDPGMNPVSGDSGGRKRKHDLAMVSTVRNAKAPPKPDERSEARAKMYMEQLAQVLKDDPDEVQKLIVACKEAMKVMSKQPTANLQWEDLTGNIFCSTGEGGGRDPSCGKGGKKGIVGKVVEGAKKVIGYVGSGSTQSRRIAQSAFDATARAEKEETYDAHVAAEELHRKAVEALREASGSGLASMLNKSSGRHRKKAKEHEEKARWHRGRAKELRGKAPTSNLEWEDMVVTNLFGAIGRVARTVARKTGKAAKFAVDVFTPDYIRERRKKPTGTPPITDEDDEDGNPLPKPKKLTRQKGVADTPAMGQARREARGTTTYEKSRKRGSLGTLR